MFPTDRPRRLRRTPALRELVRETRLDAGDFIYPLFVRSGKGIKSEIAAMPGNYHFSVDRLVQECGEAMEDGVRSVILFGIPDHKDAVGTAAYDDGAPVHEIDPIAGTEEQAQLVDTVTNRFRVAELAIREPDEPL